jgi:hypothetical protein
MFFQLAEFIFGPPVLADAALFPAETLELGSRSNCSGMFLRPVVIMGFGRTLIHETGRTTTGLV